MIVVAASIINSCGIRHSLAYQPPTPPAVEPPEAGPPPLPDEDPFELEIVGPVPQDQPIGTSIELDALTDAVAPTFEWSAKCTVIRTGFPDSPHIEECIGVAGTQEYKVKVTDAMMQSVDEAYPVEFCPSNRYRMQSLPTVILEAQPRNFFVSRKKVTFKYRNSEGDDVDIVPCSQVCVRESWRFRKNPAVGWINRFQGELFGGPRLGPWPDCPPQGTGGYTVDGSQGRIQGGTWIWDPPTLTDVQWFPDLPQIQDTPVGTILGWVKHHYKIRGYYCNPIKAPWKLRTKVLQMKVVVKLGNGGKKVVEIRPDSDDIDDSLDNDT